MEDLIEILAEIEHNRQMEWSKALVQSEKRLSFARIEKWKKLWKPYAELTEEEKEKDRVYPRKVLQAIWQSKWKVEGFSENLFGKPVKENLL